MYDDTIAAIATPIGEGAIGVVRLSGPDSLALAGKVFSGRFSHRYLSRGRIVDPDDGSVLDEVMATCMLAPNSYTCEDTVEIYGHGGPIPLQAVLKALLRCGAVPRVPVNSPCAPSSTAASISPRPRLSSMS